MSKCSVIIHDTSIQLDEQICEDEILVYKGKDKLE